MPDAYPQHFLRIISVNLQNNLMATLPIEFYKCVFANLPTGFQLEISKARHHIHISLPFESLFLTHDTAFSSSKNGVIWANKGEQIK